MKNNEYAAAEAVELGKAEEVIRGQKVEFPAIENTGEPPYEWLYVE